MTLPGKVVQNRDAIINAVANGQSISKIAADLGIDRKTITRNLIDDPEYLAAQQHYHDSRLDDAEDMLLEAATHEDVPSRAGRASAARSYWSAVSWRAERLDRRYAAKQDVTINQTVSILSAIEEAQARVIQGSCTQVIEQSSTAQIEQQD